MTYQNLGYWVGQANDTSTGRHPTGWTNGQRWLETAPEWMAMYDASQAALTAMTNDRDYWYQQYQAMLADRNAWQASSQTWEARANQAWGPNRAWNSGPSFEDQAWTGSGYGSGELWETAYNRVLPPSYYVLSNSGTLNRQNGQMCHVTLDRTGYWALAFTGEGSSATNGAGNAHFSLNAGAAGTFDAFNDGGSGCDIHCTVGLYQAGVWGAGQVIYVNFDGQSTDNNLTGTLRCHFAASQQYPH